jgi:hypothetical protein
MEILQPKNTVIFSSIKSSFSVKYGEPPNRHRPFFLQEWFVNKLLDCTKNMHEVSYENVKNVIIHFNCNNDVDYDININLPYWIENVYIYDNGDTKFDVSTLKIPFGCNLHYESEDTDWSFWPLNTNKTYEVLSLYCLNL